MSDEADGGFFTTVAVRTVSQHVVPSLDLDIARLDARSSTEDWPVNEPYLGAIADRDPETAMRHVR